MRFEPTASRLWKRLPREERRLAAAAFLHEPVPELLASALSAIVRARHVRPQVARAMAPEEQAAALAGILDPGEALAGSLLVALHLGERRPLLAAFLDGLGLPHEDGVMKEEAEARTLEAAFVERTARELTGRFPAEQVELYFNVLLLQDPERWEPIRALSGPGSAQA
ncbi:MAG TPA: hypothetical protein VFM88_09445 [Vicinamibacteria bacterium]|nr:hypothetical protein [Vicinamibacteria bacterium]